MTYSGNWTVADASPVVNASPLILLSRAGLLDFLQLVGDPVIVPKPVADEIRARGDADPTASALIHTDWLKVADPGPIPTAVADYELGPGESAVLAWALAHPGAEAIIDDLTGRRCANTLHISVRGTLGLVLVAKQRGLIESARPIIETLRRVGMYVSDHVVAQALAKVGE
jgi:predicted nucleic acid-binding protein